jgi:hypothetical protein
MHDRDVERLLRRYRPADPAQSLDERIAGLAGAPTRREPRAWPWAAAAAALLAITVGLHASVRSPANEPSTDPGFTEDVSSLAAEFGGAPAAHRLAESMLLREAAERERQQEASQSR